MIKIFSKDFNKYYKKLDNKTKVRVWDAIQKLPEGHYSTLQGKHIPPVFRIRIGKYRILFEMNMDVIRIVEMDTRGDVYKGL